MQNEDYVFCVSPNYKPTCSSCSKETQSFQKLHTFDYKNQLSHFLCKPCTTYYQNLMSICDTNMFQCPHKGCKRIVFG